MTDEFGAPDEETMNWVRSLRELADKWLDEIDRRIDADDGIGAEAAYVAFREATDLRDQFGLYAAAHRAAVED